MPDDQPEPRPIWGLRYTSAEEAQARVGQTINRGGIDYRVTGYKPVATLEFQLLGHQLEHGS